MTTSRCSVSMMSCRRLARWRSLLVRRFSRSGRLRPLLRARFGQAGAAEGVAGLQVVAGDVQARVLAEQRHDGARVHGQRFADAANLVGEGNLGGVEGVAGVFHHLGGGPVDHGGFLAKEVFHQVGWRRGAIARADDRERRRFKVRHRRALAEELGVVENLQHPAQDEVRQEGLYELLRAAGQHRAAEDERVVLGRLAERVADFAGDTAHVVEVQSARRVRRRADADDGQFGVSDGVGATLRGAEQALGLRALQQFVQAWLDDGRDAVVEVLDLGRMHVHADDVMAVAGEAPRRDRSHVAQTEDADSHASREARKRRMKCKAARASAI